MKITSKVLALGLTAMAFFAFAPRAQAATILVFGQNGTTNTITATAAGGSTTITGTGISVTITAIDAAIPTPLSAFLNFSVTNTSDAIVTGAGDISQDFGGSFTITSNANGTGINYLSGTFTDTASGAPGGNSLTLNAAQPPDTVDFTSDVISTLGDPTSLTFGFTNLTPPLAITGAGTNATIASFTASVAGNMSATGVVPAPAALPLLLAGAPLLGLAGLRKWRKRA